MSVTLEAVDVKKTTDRGIYIYIAAYSAVLNAVLLIAPVIAGKLTERFGASPTEIGALFSLELASFSLASLPAYLWIRRLNLRTATYLFTTLVVLGHVLSGFADSLGILMMARFITSVASGSIIVILLAISGKATNPGRAFGVFVVSQLIMGALILAVFPVVFASAEVSAIYWTLALLTGLCLLAARFINGEELQKQFLEKVTSKPVTTSKRHETKTSPIHLGLGLGALLLFYVALSSVWTFIAQISEAAAIDLSASSIVLSIATVAGIASALAATILGETPRRRIFLTCGYLGMTLSIVLLFGVPEVVRFALAAIIFKFAWTFILPYLLSMLSDLGGPNIMIAVNLFIGAGFAIGPFLGGFLIESTGGFNALLIAATSGLLLSMIAVEIIQRKKATALK